MSGAWSETRLSLALHNAAGASSDFDLNPGVALPDTPLRPAGVLAAFHADDGRLVLTKRASGLRHHPGQIALPGGKVDPGDADAVAAALREAHEEVGLAPAQARVLGCLPPHRTVTGFQITPVIAIIAAQASPYGVIAFVICDAVEAPQVIHRVATIEQLGCLRANSQVAARSCCQQQCCRIGLTVTRRHDERRTPMRLHSIHVSTVYEAPSSVAIAAIATAAALSHIRRCCAAVRASRRRKQLQVHRLSHP